MELATAREDQLTQELAAAMDMIVALEKELAAADTAGRMLMKTAREFRAQRDEVIAELTGLSDRLGHAWATR